MSGLVDVIAVLVALMGAGAAVMIGFYLWSDRITAARWFKYRGIFLEVFPGHVADVVGHGVDVLRPSATDKCPGGYETLHGAVLDAMARTAHLVYNVRPKDVFLVFSESVEALKQAAAREIALHSAAGPAKIPLDGDGQRRQKHETEDTIVLLYKLRRPASGQDLRQMQQHGGYDGCGMRVSWHELPQILQDIENRTHAQDAATTASARQAKGGAK